MTSKACGRKASPIKSTSGEIWLPFGEHQPNTTTSARAMVPPRNRRHQAVPRMRVTLSGAFTISRMTMPSMPRLATDKKMAVRLMA